MRESTVGRLFFGELFGGGGACVGIGSVCMYCTEYWSNKHPVYPNPKQPTHLSVIGTRIHRPASPRATAILSKTHKFYFRDEPYFLLKDLSFNSRHT